MNPTPPVGWGTDFIVPSSLSRSESSSRKPDLIRVVAGDSGAGITTSLPAPHQAFALAPGEHADLWTTQNTYIGASDPGRLQSHDHEHGRSFAAHDSSRRRVSRVRVDLRPRGVAGGVRHPRHPQPFARSWWTLHHDHARVPCRFGPRRSRLQSGKVRLLSDGPFPT